MAYLSTDVTRNDPVFGSRFIGKPADKKTFPDNEQNAYDVYQVVHDELYLDGNARQNLATFCQTFEEEELHWLMDLLHGLCKGCLDSMNIGKSSLCSCGHARQGRISPNGSH